jgi:hypothetical protein
VATNSAVSGQFRWGGKKYARKRAVKSMNGWMKLFGPPVAHRASATPGSVAAVTAARMPMLIVIRRRQRRSDTRPQLVESAAMLSAHGRCARSALGSSRASVPTRPATVHSAPEVRSASGPSSRGSSSARRGVIDDLAPQSTRGARP